MTFKAVTWNPYHGTPAKKVRDEFLGQVAEGVSIFGMQEAESRDLGQMVRDAGYRTTSGGHGLRLAWDPTAWPGAVIREPVRLSRTPWFPEGVPDSPIFTDALHVILCDEDGQTLELWNFHAAPHTQGKGWPENRKRSTIETLTALHAQMEDSLATAVLATCDLNWGPDEGYQDPRMTVALAPLKVWQAPHATLGPTREIDHLIGLPRRSGGGLRSVGAWAVPGGGSEDPAHWIHGREFRWVRR